MQAFNNGKRHAGVRAALIATVLMPIAGRAQTVIWSQPTNIADITKIVTVHDKYPYEWNRTQLMMYDRCIGDVQPQPIGDWNLAGTAIEGVRRPLTNVGWHWDSIAKYQIGCGPSAGSKTSPHAWSNASSAKGDVIGFIADTTTVQPPNRGLDLWLAYGFGPNTAKGIGPNLTVFQADAQVPWYWQGRMQADGSWKDVDKMPWGFGGGLLLELSFYDTTSNGKNTFYILVPAFAIQGQGFVQPPPGLNCDGGGLPQIQAAFGTNNKYSTVWNGNTQLGQYTTWTGWKTFAYAFTPAQFTQMVLDINAQCAPAVPYSTNYPDYVFEGIFWGDELVTGKKDCDGLGIDGYCWGVSIGNALRHAVLEVE